MQFSALREDAMEHCFKVANNHGKSELSTNMSAEGAWIRSIAIGRGARGTSYE